MKECHKQNARRQRGFTLLELMVAAAIGLIITGAIMVLLVQANNSSALIGRRGEMQMNARAALNMITQDLSLSGTGLHQIPQIQVPNTTTNGQRIGCYYVSGGPPACYLPSSSSSPAGVSTANINGNPAPTSTNNSYLFVVNPLPGQGVNDMRNVASDVVTVLYVDFTLNLGGGQYPLGALPATGASATFNITPGNPCLDDSAVGLQAGDTLLFTAPNGARAIATVSGVAVNGGGCTVGGSGGSGSGGGTGANQVLFATSDPFNFNQSSAIAGSLNALIAGNSGASASSYSVVRLAMVTYFLQNNNGSLQLLRQYGARTAVPVADNISQLQITYDTYNSSGIVDAATSAAYDGGTTGSSSTIAPAEIKKINVVLGVRSVRPDSHGVYDNLAVRTTVAPRDLDFTNQYTGSISGSGSGG